MIAEGPLPVTVQHHDRLSHGQLTQVLALIRSATGADGVAPLSEQALLGLRDAHPASGPAHFLGYSGAHLGGYAHLEPVVADEPAAAEVVVDPSWRRRGIGRSLIQVLEGEVGHAGPPGGGSLRLWSHGDLDTARALARHHGYTIVRELWQMRRSLQPGSTPLPQVRLPDGFRARHFVVGQDEQAWLGVNARAFADHPEQGRMTRDDLDRRIAEPWFDAEGFILIEDVRGPGPVLAASHWTKVVAADAATSPSPDRPAGQPTGGEVYVVGVDPAYQGMGLGRSVTVLGLTYLRGRGLAEATLYVDADNLPAVATYSRLDFHRFAVDIMYGRIVHTPM